MDNGNGCDVSEDYVIVIDSRVLAKTLDGKGKRQRAACEVRTQMQESQAWLVVFKSHEWVF